MNYLYGYYSSLKCLISTDRHMRLCRQIPRGAKYEQAIIAFYNDLLAKSRLLEEAERNSMAAHDLVKLFDKLLDNELIKLSHRSEEYDKENAGSFTLTTLFPNGNYGEVTHINMYKEPAKVLEIALKVESLGETHALFPFATTLRTAVTASEKSIKDETDAIKLEGAAKANCEIAKLALIRRYNNNYYQAASDEGKEFAENLFPDLGGKDPQDEPPVG